MTIIKPSYPKLLSVQSGTNGELIAGVARLWFPENPEGRHHPAIFDMTYGRGLWWTHTMYPIIYQPGADFTNLVGVSSNKFHVVAFDPPYIALGGRSTSNTPEFNDRYGLADAPKNPALVDDAIAKGLAEAYRIGKPGHICLVKVMDYVTSGRFHQGRLTTLLSAHAVGYEQVDEIIHVTGTGPQPTKNRDGSRRRQVHSRHAHSFLLVLKAGRKK